MSAASRVCTVALAASLLVLAPGATAVGMDAGVWAETRFQTGCDPGPAPPPPWPDPVVTHLPPADAAEQVTLDVDLDHQLADARGPVLGSGFNFEHALWSCPEFRSLFRTQILDPFQPAIARVDSGLLPAAPSELPAWALGPAVYESVLSSAPYADSWRFFKRLNRAGVKIVLGVWGGPAQFTLDGTRRGVLDPAHYDDYVDYVATLVHFIVHSQDVQLWATTIANEPDGGDGNQIPPDGLAYIAHQLASRVAADGVKLYGPDTADSRTALQYLPALLNDPIVVDNLAFVGFHQYYASNQLSDVVRMVHARQPDLPVIVTEYTSFLFGDLDAGQEAHNEYGYTLDLANTLLAHYRAGAATALYWDAVDYLQPGHDAITRWGLLRGPDYDFARRPRYYSLLQILPYLQPGAVVLADQQDGGADLRTLEVRTSNGQPAIVLLSQDFGELDLTIQLHGAQADRYRSWSVTRFARGHLGDQLGRQQFQDGTAHLILPPRSITTLFPSGAAPLPETAQLLDP
jgi:O-glycosyl hydrolase